MSDKKESERRNFDCSVCKKLDWNKKRACYLTQKIQTFQIPITEWVGSRLVIKQEKDIVEVDKNGFIEIVSKLQGLSPDLPLAEIISKHFRDVCIKSLLDYSDIDWVELENFCSEYGCLPLSTTMCDHPYYIIEAFNTIRNTRNAYERIRQRELLSKVNKDSGK